MLTHLHADTPLPVLWAWMFVTGLGVGPTFAVFAIIVQNSVAIRAARCGDEQPDVLPAGRRDGRTCPHRDHLCDLARRAGAGPDRRGWCPAGGPSARSRPRRARCRDRCRAISVAHSLPPCQPPPAASSSRTCRRSSERSTRRSQWRHRTRSCWASGRRQWAPSSCSCFERHPLVRGSRKSRPTAMPASENRTPRSDPRPFTGTNGGKGTDAAWRAPVASRVRRRLASIPRRQFPRERFSDESLVDRRPECTSVSSGSWITRVS